MSFDTNPLKMDIITILQTNQQNDSQNQLLLSIFSSIPYGTKIKKREDKIYQSLKI